MATLNICEIKPGLVPHLDPDILREYGAEQCRVIGKHDFLILSVDNERKMALLQPLTSKRGRGRRQIPRDAKRGHPRWTDRSTYFMGKPFWAPIPAVQEASSEESSKVNQRNSVDLSKL